MITQSDLVPIIAQEECAEVIQAISKIFRFGLDTLHCETGISNKKALETEMGQLLYMLQETVQYYDLDSVSIWQAADDKQQSFDKWAEYAPKAEV